MNHTSSKTVWLVHCKEKEGNCYCYVNIQMYEDHLYAVLYSLRSYRCSSSMRRLHPSPNQPSVGTLDEEHLECDYRLPANLGEDAHTHDR